MNSSVDVVLPRLQGVRNTGSFQYLAKCPSHDDSSPSLSVKVADNGSVLINCYSGCSFNKIVSAMDLLPRDLFVNRDDLQIHHKYSRRQLHKQILHERLILLIAKSERENGIAPQADDIEREARAEALVKKFMAVITE